MIRLAVASGETSGTGEATIAAVEVFVVLIAAAVLVALVARRYGLPYTVALVCLGAAVSAIGLPVHIVVTPELVLIVLVPGLVFEAAYRLDIDQLRRVLVPAVVLAVPGVLVSAAAVAVVLLAAGLTLPQAVLVGTIVSATDPVSVIATFKTLRAPAALATLVEAESLLNDGMAVVIFTLAVQAVNGPVDPLGALGTFIVTVIVSGVLGWVCGLVGMRLVARAHDEVIELAVSVVVAYGTYLLADRLGQSGIIAAVTAGLVLGTYARRLGLARRTLEALDQTWEFIAFLLTAVVFLLIGFVITVGDLAGAAPAIALGVVGVFIGRAIIVYGLVGGGSLLLRRLRGGHRPMRLAWLHVVFWAGLRGAIAVGLALALPESTPDRARLQGIVFGITLFTLLVQGGTTDLLLRRLGLHLPPAGISR